MVKLNKIYTKTGDDGTTGLSDGSRVKKYDLRPTSYGEVDELNSYIGLILNSLKKDENYTYLIDILKKIQNDLFDLGADLSTPYEKEPKFAPLRIKKSQVLFLEGLIDKFNKKLKPLNSFILPGGGEISSWLHVARTVARRAERSTSKLSDEKYINKHSLIYLNRLSDFLFVVSRITNDNGNSDVLWVPGENQWLNYEGV